MERLGLSFLVEVSGSALFYMALLEDMTVIRFCFDRKLAAHMALVEDMIVIGFFLDRIH